MPKSIAKRVVALLLVTPLAVGSLLAAGCGSGDWAAFPESAATRASPGQGGTSEFVAEVWADNWFALYVGGELVGEDSTPITTERSFNAETIAFTATYPLTIAIEAKDFKETDSGIEYIGKRNQQMGDGGLIAQITDVGTGKVVAVTNSGWRLKVIHRAPLNPECEKAQTRTPRAGSSARRRRQAGPAPILMMEAGAPPPSGPRPTCAPRTATTRSHGTARPN